MTITVAASAISRCCPSTRSSKDRRFVAVRARRGGDAADAKDLTRLCVCVRARVDGQRDIIDETLEYFKANVFFRNYEIKGNADRVLVYLTLYTSDALGKLARCQSKNEGVRAMQALAIENFSLPGDRNFPLNQLYTAPKDRAEAGTPRPRRPTHGRLRFRA